MRGGRVARTLLVVWVCWTAGEGLAGRLLRAIDGLGGRTVCVVLGAALSSGGVVVGRGPKMFKARAGFGWCLCKRVNGRGKRKNWVGGLSASCFRE